MLFSSNIFLFLFFPLFLFSYAAIAIVTRKKVVFANLFLIACSLFFYLWGNGNTVLLLILTLFVNTLIGRLIERSSHKKPLLTIGIVYNLSFLIYFKYANFILAQLGSGPVSSFLPVGISFYTFMAISYLIDVYRGKYRSTNLINFSVFLTLFPHLVAGPIVRFSEIKEEIRSRTYSIEDFYEGMIRFCLGLGKKVIIADSLGRVADTVFALPLSELSWKTAWIGILLYTFQILYDFSGYSDMAIGIARMIGFHFPENFNYPYLSTSLTEFWQRWHMTLRKWFVEYVYIPLGGSRGGDLSTYRNIFIVFLLTGIWHGAAWTFVVWGMYNGIILIIERYLDLHFKLKGKGIFGNVITLFLVMIGWVFFRRVTISDAIYHLQTMVGLHVPAFEYFLPRYFLDNRTLFLLCVAIFFAFVPRMNHLQRFYFLRSIFALGVLAYAIILLSKIQFTPFIYFQF